MGRDVFYAAFSCDGINFVKSFMDAPVADNIFAILFVDGQRGCPCLDQRLLLLNVVGSRPLHFANPEHVFPCSDAKLSIAFQTSSWFMMFSPFGGYAFQFKKKIIIMCE